MKIANLKFKNNKKFSISLYPITKPWKEKSKSNSVANSFTIFSLSVLKGKYFISLQLIILQILFKIQYDFTNIKCDFCQTELPNHTSTCTLEEFRARAKELLKLQEELRNSQKEIK